MDTLYSLTHGILTAAAPLNLLYGFAGVLLGTLVGVLPGLGPAGAIALLLPLALHAPPLAYLIMLFGITYGAQYGGSTTSILVNIPGEASSVITCLDGYAMARQGRAGPALGIAAFGSFVGGTLSILGVAYLAPALAEFGLRFGPPEYAALMLFGLTALVYLAHGPMDKAILMALFGMLLASVGLDPVTGQPRFTFNFLVLRDGVGLTPVVIGLFGVAEVLINLRSEAGEIFQTKIKGLLPTRQDWKDSSMPIARGTLLGFFVGAIPGLNVVIATFAAYALEKKLSKHPEKFGRGAIEGVAAPETANNAASCSGWIPLLSLGLPTGSVTSLIFGALLIHGLVPGPLFIKNSPEIFWGVLGSMIIGNAILLILNLPLIGLWIKVLQVPYYFLFPLIILFGIIGAYTATGNTGDVLIMIVFGAIGYFMRKFAFEPAPMVLGLVIGPLLETAIRRSMIMSKGDFGIFFQRPIAAFFMGAALLMLLSPLLTRRRLGHEIIEKLEEQ
ncbi:MAG TPA: tripartite tricarboxylate transporter permease [Candidatus Saccharimonadales bacterium]|nr:tripartite tricarboxylate transporter permease [Candidatus Saccharimonadales bacterium]